MQLYRRIATAAFLYNDVFLLVLFFVLSRFVRLGQDIFFPHLSNSLFKVLLFCYAEYLQPDSVRRIF
jgi:hypothetical protein